MSATTIAFLGPVWLLLGATICVCAARASRSYRAVTVGCRAVSALWVAAGAAVNTGLLVSGATYTGFADAAYLPFVRDTWDSLVVPHHQLFIGLLVVFEASAGLLVLVPGRPRQWALLALVAFTVALTSFGWGFYVWSVPMTIALLLLWRAERRRVGAPPSTEARSAPARHERLPR